MKNFLISLFSIFVALSLYAQPGTPFESFNAKNDAPDNKLDYNSMPPVLVQLKDGGILTLGRFGEYDGQSHVGIVKTWPNGQLDDEFYCGIPDFIVGNDACQDSTNKIFVGVDRDGSTADYLFILDETGAVISSFGPTNGPNEQVLKTVYQYDQLYISGDFTSYAGVPQNKIARLNLDGTLDGGFQSRFTASDEVRGMQVMSNGRVLVYGDFDEYDGQSALGMVILNADGSFYRGNTAGSSLAIGMNAITLSSGKILAAFRPTGNLKSLHYVDTNLVLTPFASFPNSQDEITTVNVNDPMCMTEDPQGRVYVTNLRYSNTFTGQSFPARYNLFKFFPSGLIDSSYHNPMEDNSFGYIRSVLAPADTALFMTTNMVFNDYRFPFQQLDTTGGFDYSLMRNPEAINPPLTTGDLAVLDADHILVGGIFGDYSGAASASVAKVNMFTGANDSTITIARSTTQLVHRIHVADNGSYFAVGDHYLMNGSSNRGIAKYLSSGVNDPTFTSPLLANQNNAVKAIDLLPDGRIMIGGNIRQGTQVKRLQLLSANGTMDVNFNAVLSGPNDDVLDIEIVDANNVYVSGAFTDYNGTARTGLIKINAAGELNTAFAPSFNGDVEEIAIDHSGKIICMGTFTTVNGATVNGFCRLNTDGSLDNSLNLGAGFNGRVRDVLIQPDSMLVIVGDFTTYNNQDFRYMLRIDNEGVVDPFFEVNLVQRPVYEIELLPDTTAVIRGLFQRIGPDYYNYLAKIELKCVAPEQPTILGSSSYVCEGQFFNAEVQGDLNGSLNWVWYKDATSSAPFSTDERISDSITQNTKFYVQAAAGCAPASDFDSIEVELRYPTAEVVYAEACNSYTWSANGAVLTSSGTYEAHIMNVQGCDSMVTLHLTFPELDTLNITVSQDSNLVQTNLTWPEYKWYNCNNNALLQVTNVPFWEPDRSYNIRLQIESADGVCRRNADCFYFTKPSEPDVTGVDENTFSSFVLYPNPAHDVIQVASEKQWDQYEILSQEGRLLQSGPNDNGPIAIDELAPGMYYLLIRNNQSQAMKAFVVE